MNQSGMFTIELKSKYLSSIYKTDGFLTLGGVPDPKKVSWAPDKWCEIIILHFINFPWKADVLKMNCHDTAPKALPHAVLEPQK